jgi:CAAX prenyl protease-like protein
MFRLAGSVITVPIAEELAFRGYLLRKLVGRDFENVPANRFTLLSFVVSSMLFGLLHTSWIAGTVAGALFAIATYHRGRVSDAIVAHMTANALIAIAVLGFGRWDLWL